MSIVYKTMVAASQAIKDAVANNPDCEAVVVVYDNDKPVLVEGYASVEDAEETAMMNAEDDFDVVIYLTYKKKHVV